TISGGSSPTGLVDFVADATTVLCSAAPVDGSFQASCGTSSLTAGTHTITANYSGDSNDFASSGSLSGGQVVVTPTAVAAGDVKITQFRFRGAAVGGDGTRNEFVELWNSTTGDITIGADGWALVKAPGAPEDVIATIPGGTIL